MKPPTFLPHPQAAFLMMHGIGGKMLVFQAGTPNLGIGRVKNRESPQIYGSDREHTLRQPEDQFFKKFASECSRAQISLDLFTFTQQYADLASWSTISRFTCGQVRCGGWLCAGRGKGEHWGSGVAREVAACTRVLM